MTCLSIGSILDENFIDPDLYFSRLLMSLFKALT